MNPEAKEFVPAHILRKRQEEAERLTDLTKQLDKVNITSDKENPSCLSKEAQFNVHDVKSTDVVRLDQHKQNRTEEPETVSSGSRTSECVGADKNDLGSKESTQKKDTLPNSKTNGHSQAAYRDEPQDLINEEDDRYLLNAGENICEFNGEEFIIPGDFEHDTNRYEDYTPPEYAGYDFGNVEDNEDEDVCNAFEEFLENLPNQ